MTIDCTKYRNAAFLQLLKANNKFRQIIANAETWQEVLNVIDSLGVKYTQGQIEFVKERQWVNN